MTACSVSRLFPALSLLVALVLGMAGCHAEAAEWSKTAIQLSYKNGFRRIAIPSPDQRKTVLIDDVGLQVIEDGKPVPGTEQTGVSTLAELAWAPDSSAFFITESYGGEVGEWIVQVYLIERERIVVMNPAGDVIRSFRGRYRCHGLEEPNVGGIAWMTNVKKLLLVAEVPPHSTCPEMGNIRGYVIEIPSGRIVQQYDEKKVRALWGRSLGSRFHSR